MLKAIVAVEPVGAYHLRLRFEDGVEGVVDIASLVELSGVFEPLKDAGYFSKVAVSLEWGTVYWPNGADLDPDVLYSAMSGEPLPPFEAHLARRARQ